MDKVNSDQMDQAGVKENKAEEKDQLLEEAKEEDGKDKTELSSDNKVNGSSVKENRANGEVDKSSAPLVTEEEDHERYGDLTKYNDEKPASKDHIRSKH